MTDLAENDPDRCLCASLRQASRRISQHYDAALAPVGISINQYSVLVRIGRLAPCTINDLAANLVMDRSTLGHLLRPLEARGFVSLGAAADDRRRKALTLTPAGVALVAQARPLWADAQHRFTATYGLTASRALRTQLDEVAVLDIPTKPSGDSQADHPAS